MIDMPPRRPLPSSVRDRLLVDLRTKMDAPPPRSKAPLAVAAGVAALVAGGVVVGTVQGTGTETGSGKITGDKGVTAQAQRCHAASKKVGGFPANADWRVVTHTALAGFTELAVKVADKPVFCETTATSVTITKFDATANVVPGSKTGTLFRGSGRAYGLVVDPAWHGIDAYDDGRLDSGPAQPGATGWRYADDMVLWWTEYSHSPLTVAPHGGKQPVPLPAAPDSTVTVVDQPYTGPAPDRTSTEGRLLAKCIQHSATTMPLADPDTWQPGPMLTGDYRTFLVIRGLDKVTSCAGDPADSGVNGLLPYSWAGDQRVVRLPSGNQPVLAPTPQLFRVHGKDLSVPYGSITPEAAKVVFTTYDHKTVTAQVRNGAFLVGIPMPEHDIMNDVVTAVTVWDAHGKVLYQGKPAVSR